MQRPIIPDNSPVDNPQQRGRDDRSSRCHFVAKDKPCPPIGANGLVDTSFIEPKCR